MVKKRIFWKHMVVGEEEVSDRLTTLNFQPNKFKLVPLEDHEVMIVYIDKEVPNED